MAPGSASGPVSKTALVGRWNIGKPNRTAPAEWMRQRDVEIWWRHEGEPAIRNEMERRLVARGWLSLKQVRQVSKAASSSG